jgi:predicted NBD/HSP70 family sugar kinase
MREIIVHGPQSRTELAGTLDVTLPSVTRLSKRLVDVGLLVEKPGQRSAGQGRPRTPLDVAIDRHQVVGVKLTSNAAFAVHTDLRARVLAEQHVPLDTTDPDHVAEQIGRVLGALDGQLEKVRGIGVTVGGHTPNRSTVVRAPFLGWKDVDFATLLTKVTGLPTVVDNDVVGLTEYLHWFGAARGLDRFAVITIGAGIGYALVVHNRIVRSAGVDLAGLGDFHLDHLGTLGRRRTVASVLSTEAICSAAARAHHRDLTYGEVMSLARAGDPACRRVVDEAGQVLGSLVATVADVALTNRVILSGEGIALAIEARPAVDAAIRAQRPTAGDVDLDVHPLDFAEWARGAAVLAIQDFVAAPTDLHPAVGAPSHMLAYRAET